MEDLIILVKTLNIYGHIAHFLCARVVFMQDHEFLSEIYQAAEDNYDHLVERCIGLDIAIDLQQINLKAAQDASKISIGSDNSTKISACLELERQTVKVIEKLKADKKITLGTETLLGDIANASEIRQYKLKQRLA